MGFPSALLSHSVKVYARTTAVDADGANAETLSLLGTAACSITGVSSSRGLNDQDAPTVSATLTGTNPLLARSNVVFEVVTGPAQVTAGLKMYPQGGMSPHGNAFVGSFYRFPVTSVLPV